MSNWTRCTCCLLISSISIHMLTVQWSSQPSVCLSNCISNTHLTHPFITPPASSQHLLAFRSIKCMYIHLTDLYPFIQLPSITYPPSNILSSCLSAQYLSSFFHLSIYLVFVRIFHFHQTSIHLSKHLSIISLFMYLSSNPPSAYSDLSGILPLMDESLHPPSTDSISTSFHSSAYLPTLPFICCRHPAFNYPSFQHPVSVRFIPSIYISLHPPLQHPNSHLIRHFHVSF